MARIIRLKHLGEMTFGEIGEVTGEPPSTVKSRYYTALDRLRKLYYQAKES